MAFELTIRTDNAAFGDRPALELSRILREISEYLTRWETFPGVEHVRDINGNAVGYWTLDSEVTE